MDLSRLRKLERRIYSRIPLIGGWLRRGAAEALVQDGSPEAVRTLAEAVARSDDEQVLSIALDRVGRTSTQPGINAVCAVWAATRHPDLTALLIERGWVASEPADVKVLSALETKQLEWVTEDGADVVEPLAQACGDADLTIAERARLALQRLKNPDAQEALCRLVIEYDHPLAREIAVAAQYAPRAPYQRVLFYFLTGQWARYESLDFDQTMLGKAYELCDERLQRRIAMRARQAGRVEWVKVVAGGRQGRRMGGMTDEEWETALTVLGGGRRWEDMWRLAQAAPAVWSVRLLQRLREVEWVPAGEEAQAGFVELVRLAEGCVGEAPEPGGLVRCRTTLIGHTDAVHCLVISPGGRLLASGSWDHTVRLWRLPDGATLKTLKGHLWYVTCLAINFDGRLLASGSLDKAVRLWRLPDGAALKTLTGHTEMVHCLALSPDGRLLASGSEDKTVRLWSLPDGRALKTLRGHTHRVYCLAISPDGRLLVSGSGDRTVRLWSLPDGRLLKTLEGHNFSVVCLAISPDGRLLASGSGDYTVRLWSLPDGAALKTLAGHTSMVQCLVISLDGRVLTSGSGDCTVRLWRLPDGAALKTLEGHAQQVSCLAISPDGRLLASGSYDTTVRLWGLEPLRHLPVGQTSLEDLVWVQEALQGGAMSDTERSWLEFLLALMRWQRRFDVEVEEAPLRIPVGEFDVEIE